MIVVLGSSNTDLVIRGPRLPRPGETVLGGSFYQAAGGKGANQAVAAARASGRPVLFLAAVGDDPLGAGALAALEADNVVTRHIKRCPGVPSGVALIMVGDGGENAISVASGANLQLSPVDIDALPDDIFAGGVFLASLESPLETVVRGLKRARAAGMRTILNPAPADPRLCERGILELVDCITPNEGEAAALAGVDTAGHDGRLAAAKRLRQLGARAVIITLGREGCLVFEDEPTFIPGRAVTAIDTTAAGDAFNGALAAALDEGRSLIAAAQFANRAAALSTTREGAQPSLPTRAQIDAAGSV